MVGYPFKTGPKNDQSYIVFHPAMLKEILALLFPDTYLNPIPVLGQRNIETFSNDNERIVSLVIFTFSRPQIQEKYYRSHFIFMMESIVYSIHPIRFVLFIMR